MSTINFINTSLGLHARDFVRFAKRRLKFELAPYRVEVDIRDKKNGGSKKAAWHVLPPHLVFSEVYHRSEAAFHDLLGCDERHSTFWKRAQIQMDAWYRNHPVASLFHHNDCATSEVKAIRIFGDDGVASRHRSFHAIHWSSDFPGKPFNSQIPFYNIDKDQLVPGKTEPQLQQVLVWSLQALLHGRHPHTDHLGMAWKDPYFAAIAGQPLAGPYRAALVGVLADMKWQFEHFRWVAFDPSCSHVGNHPCWLCTIQREHLADFSFDAPSRNHGLYMGSAAAAASPLSSIPGFHMSQVWVEPMHAGGLGVASHICGNILVELSGLQVFAPKAQGEWKLELDHQLQHAHVKFVAWAKANFIQQSQNKFSANMVDMHVKSKSWPMLKAKAANCFCVLQFLVDVLAPRKEMSEQAMLQYLTARGCDTFFRVWRQAEDPDWLNPEELAKFKQAGEELFICYNRLSSLAAAGHRARWPVKPKLHALIHLYRDILATSRNGASRWSFADEDQMGRQGKLAAKTNINAQSSAVLFRWLIAFFDSIPIA